jgi:hypothetical protein
MAFSRQAEQIKTLFHQLGDVKDKHDTHVAKLDNLVNRVSDLCARFDMMMAGMGQFEPGGGNLPGFPRRGSA